MIATLTSKGQITFPKAIRETLGLTAGSKVDFQIEPNGSVRLRPLQRGAAGLFGLLHDPSRPPGTSAEMDLAIGRHLAEDDKRIQADRGNSITRRKAFSA